MQTARHWPANRQHPPKKKEQSRTYETLPSWKRLREDPTGFSRKAVYVSLLLDQIRKSRMKRSAFPIWRWIIPVAAMLAAASERVVAEERDPANQPSSRAATEAPALLTTAEQVHGLSRE